MRVHFTQRNTPRRSDKTRPMHHSWSVAHPRSGIGNAAWAPVGRHKEACDNDVLPTGKLILPPLLAMFRAQTCSSCSSDSKMKRWRCIVRSLAYPPNRFDQWNSIQGYCFSNFSPTRGNVRSLHKNNLFSIMAHFTVSSLCSKIDAKRRADATKKRHDDLCFLGLLTGNSAVRGIRGILARAVRCGYGGHPLVNGVEAGQSLIEIWKWNSRIIVWVDFNIKKRLKHEGCFRQVWQKNSYRKMSCRWLCSQKHFYLP